ncbi:hypothetical protein A3B21_05040 [Candidatus Uhrbacteria bacterium RIFCSPLOWO2_01_FULL_47_24]|uniref:Uncharacterized protein n=1 Tax=Candidatus Uhrbacteria bacterium RIFCSPLOWO2_01_FULL_47_24 TaxID=1802401 RepID=A0A1F7UUT2_9BACT|nr:MAG: hypothetical protein A2753_03075 [Candidatus Uhrbacteria bacterium RIFCSPHIGHO2_01_FULL_47_11]OGL69317.1 MAG: hypothetical protein A3D58_03430 [Candidatus Uhrbacteria bacterium RIFCSPHIGHO2_02_FULL_46_47]OGL76387.1 MAG: hypothetical protein A3F52_00720 [Candidatus Uhrbacteria bacterium RIFCSPHIGHO2_12_FULL_47_11]OGL82052.1 MAG: hypothetical protein A3B21_05040 [Candidatus Uhrbacteria bacterium RIFCSPLOWO2_01_FULL_47_24]OGL85446.1 MAG: hypothetical protein A3J03_05205 [Candidatus Uhrbact
MHSKLKYFLFYILHSAFFISPASAVAPATPTAAEEVKAGLLKTAEKAGLTRAGATARQPAEVAGELVGYLLSFVGVIFFALAIYGGIIWMTARGNEEKVKKAQELIKDATIGLIVVFLSYTITNFIVTRLLLQVQ